MKKSPRVKIDENSEKDRNSLEDVEFLLTLLQKVFIKRIIQF